MSNRSALTLVELLVVLVVLGLGSVLVAPALLFPEAPERQPYEPVLEGAVELAATREEIVRLEVADDGSWRILGSTDAREAVAHGSMDAYRGSGFALLVSPLGSCGPAPGTEPPFPVDPLTCTVP